MSTTRIDKWLWSVRIFKSRSKATDACKSKKISINEKTAKPSTLVAVGDKIIAKKDGFNFEFLVKDIISKRVSATLAEPCYENITPESEINKYKNWFIGKGAPERRDKGAGRPTKKERREIEEFKEIDFNDFFDEE